MAVKPDADEARRTENDVFRSSAPLRSCSSSSLLLVPLLLVLPASWRPSSSSWSCFLCMLLLLLLLLLLLRREKKDEEGCKGGGVRRCCSSSCWGCETAVRKNDGAEDPNSIKQGLGGMSRCPVGVWEGRECVRGLKSVYMCVCAALPDTAAILSSRRVLLAAPL